MPNPFAVDVPDVAQSLLGFQRARKLRQDAATQRQNQNLAAERLGLLKSGQADQRAATASDQDFRERKFAESKRQFNSPKGKDGKFGLTPFFVTGPDGRPKAFQLSNKGGATEIVLPDGSTPATGFSAVDTGTGTAIFDKRTNQQIGFVPKDVSGKASQAAQGKAKGELKARLSSMKSKLPGLRVVVKELNTLADKATFTRAGQLRDAGMRQAGISPGDAAIARASYISKVNNQVLPMLRDTFGAAFTEREGESLKATLGDPDLHPDEKKAVLKSFIEQKTRDVDALETQAGAQPDQRGPDARGIPSGAVDMLRQSANDPAVVQQFEAKYGPGSASRALGR